MEKKKLLLVAVSVGVFLVIVVSAAILVFSPPAAAFSASSQAVSGPAAPPDNVTHETGFIQNAPAPVADTSPEAGITPSVETGLIAEPKGDGPATISIQPLLAAGVPDTAAKPAAPKPAAKPAAPAPAAAPAKPAAAPAVSKKTYHDFWIQVGSYSTRERADGAKLTLDDKGLAAIITNQTVAGEIRYRVRVGPYTSKNEADYWLAMIKDMDSFKDSLIWESQSYR